jgi:hypothetical protein
MGYPSKQNFDLTHIKRTKQNLEEYEGKYDFTMLLNSLLGLIILPNEFNVKGQREYSFDFLEHKVTNFSELSQIFKISEIILCDETGKEVQQNKFYWLSKSNNKLNPSEIKLSELLNRIRNGIAHFGIIPTKDRDIWEGLIIRNYPENNNEHNFEVYLTQQELKQFALFIANKYLETVKK